jgi:hypothetical protein
VCVSAKTIVILYAEDAVLLLLLSAWGLFEGHTDLAEGGYIDLFAVKQFGDRTVLASLHNLSKRRMPRELYCKGSKHLERIYELYIELLAYIWYRNFPFDLFRNDLMSHEHQPLSLSVCN